MWKPIAPRTSYVREEDLNARYLVVSPTAVRDWWIRQHALVPEVETREAYIVAGAIIPLWQKLKTKDGAKLKVVRVSTEDGQRIVGVEIPGTRVGPILRTLGIKGLSSPNPEQIFHELLDGGAAFLGIAWQQIRQNTRDIKGEIAERKRADSEIRAEIGVEQM
ncbi:MAG TPA: hypothetical protein VKZ53_27980 [Candidatus Angelobacter sp.]|nr:hypothetical protein [Candidatus Angelobacter sp.]